MRLSGPSRTLIATALLTVAGSWAFALQPPTREQLKRYREDGSLELVLPSDRELLTKAGHVDLEISARGPDGQPVKQVRRIELGPAPRPSSSRRGAAARLMPLEQKQTMGARIFLKSIRMPSEVWIPAVLSLLPTKRLSTISCISPPLRITCPPHQRSNPR